jgi:voltage-gated potassium channel
MAVDKLRRTLFSKFDALVHEAFANEESKLYGVVSNFVVLVIIYSIVGIIFESVVELHAKYEAFFRISEYIVVGIFIAEYAGQVHVTRPRRKYIFGLWGIIDFLAIAPSLIQWLDLRQLKIARILRVMRFLRLMRIMKLAKTVTADYEKTKGKKSSTLKMDLQIYFITMFSVLVISSTLVFYAESGQENTGFTNIPTSMWWGITTMTTVGYGDLTPETVAGRVVAGITALCGLALFAMLMNVVGKALMQGLFGHEDDEETGAVIEARSLLSVSERMDESVRLRDQELVTPDEFEAKRRKLVENI